MMHSIPEIMGPAFVLWMIWLVAGAIVLEFEHVPGLLANVWKYTAGYPFVVGGILVMLLSVTQFLFHWPWGGR